MKMRDAKMILATGLALLAVTAAADDLTTAVGGGVGAAAGAAIGNSVGGKTGAIVGGAAGGAVGGAATTEGKGRTGAAIGGAVGGGAGAAVGHSVGGGTGAVVGAGAGGFAVWAPNAASIHVMGSFNDWSKHSHPLRPRGNSGIWEGFIPGVQHGAHYKYHLAARQDDSRIDKADPVAFLQEMPPATGSVVWDLDYDWGDQQWMKERGGRQRLQSPISVYEVHLGSWGRVPEEGYRSLHYREIAPRLADHVRQMGFTHVEVLPVMEHPFFGSWGYQVTGYFAPSSRYGAPQDFMYLVDYLHQHEIGVILDWVPSHFPSDGHGLAYFDGTYLFEHADPRQGYHPDWSSYIFNYGRHRRSRTTDAGLRRNAACNLVKRKVTYVEKS